MKSAAEKSSATSTTVTQPAQQPFIARAGRGDFLAPAQAAAPAVQMKMEVNKPGDKFEQEADKMADNVIRMPTPPVRAKDDKLPRPGQDRLQKKDEEKIQKAALPEEKVQKKDEDKIQKAGLPEEKIQKAGLPEEKIQKAGLPEEKIQKAGLPEEKVQKAALPEEKVQKAGLPEEKVQKKEDDKLQKAQAPEEKLQRKGSDAAPAVGGDVQSAIRGKTAGGQPLSADVRGQMESGFDADFGNVRIHSDPQSASLNNRLSARAFTYQNHIFFSRDQYQPGTSEGKKLLAHELTHTIQQGHAVQRSPQLTTTTTPPPVQRLGVQDALDKFADWAYNIPGFRLLTHVKRQRVPRIGLLPLFFSRDGRRLVALFGGDDLGEAYAVDVVHGGARRVAHGGLRPTMFSDDGRFIYGDTASHTGQLPIASRNNVIRVAWTKGARPHVLVRHAALPDFSFGNDAIRSLIARRAP